MDKKCKERYKIINRFYINGVEFVTVRFNNAAHTMPYEEWKFVWGYMHPNHWEWGKKKYK